MGEIFSAKKNPSLRSNWGLYRDSTELYWGEKGEKELPIESISSLKCVRQVF